jgi:hypothetical protein
MTEASILVAGASPTMLPLQQQTWESFSRRAGDDRGVLGSRRPTAPPDARPRKTGPESRPPTGPVPGVYFCAVSGCPARPVPFAAVRTASSGSGARAPVPRLGIPGGGGSRLRAPAHRGTARPLAGLEALQVRAEARRRARGQAALRTASRCGRSRSGWVIATSRRRRSTPTTRRTRTRSTSSMLPSPRGLTRGLT